MSRMRPSPAGGRAVSIGRKPVDGATAAHLAARLAALADPVRLRLFDIVRRSGSRGVCSCDLTGPLDRSQPTVSHHLKVLREAGLVDSRREGTWVWYSVTDDGLTDVLDFLDR